jgi:hypothetical protein
MKSRSFQPDNLLNLFASLAIAVFLGLLIWHTISMLWPSLGIPWFASSDESILLAEVIRFSGFNFYQSFFDMPGTPLMMLGAAEWRLYYTLATFLHGSSADVNVFTFQHLQQLFTWMRVNSLVFFILSALLLFRIVSKATNKYAGAAAATLLLMNSGYETTVPFVRVEPLAMCFMLAAIIALTESKGPLGSLWAGLLCGIGAACRLHSITASLPVLVLLVVFRNWTCAREYSVRFTRLAALLAAAALLGSILSYRLFALVPTPWSRAFPRAYALFAEASWAAGLLVLALVSAYLIPMTRPLVWKAVTPDLLALFAGAGIGVLAGVPTALLRIDAFLQSVDFYETAQYQDPIAAHLPLFEKWTSLFHTYLPIIFPDKFAAALFVAGACLLFIIPRLRSLAPYLMVALAFFVSRPLGLVRGFHHAALWIPFYALVGAIPFAVFADLSAAKKGAARYLIISAAVVALFALRFQAPDSSDMIRGNMAGHGERVRNIASADKWISAHVDKNTPVMAAFYCFDPGTFYVWFRSMGLTVPADDPGPPREIWWGNSSALRGRSGVACLGGQDYPVLKQAELLRPGGELDPLRDARFRLVKSFGRGSTQIDIFQFDFR